MKTTPFSNTPAGRAASQAWLGTLEGREHYNAIPKHFALALQKAKHSPCSQIGVWSQLYKAQVDDLALDCAPGSAGIYRLSECARGVIGAAKIMSGHGDTPMHRRPIRAIECMTKFVGFRYFPACKAISALIAESRHGGPKRMAMFEREREAFFGEWGARLDAAHTVNDNGENPRSAVRAVRDLANELMSMGEWVDVSGGLVTFMWGTPDQALALLDDAEAREPRVKSRKARRRG